MHHAGRRTTTVLLGALLTGLLAAAPASALTTAPLVAPHPRVVAPAPGVTPVAAPVATPAPTVTRLPRILSRTPLRLVNRRYAHRAPTTAS